MAPQQSCQERAAHQSRRALIREATKTPKTTLKKLQSSTAEIGLSVHRTTLISDQSLNKKISKHILCSPKSMRETSQLYGRRYSGQMRLKLIFLAIKENAISGANPTPLITPRTPSPQEHHHAVGMFFIGRDWESG